jgi:hypothetical protein
MSNRTQPSLNRSSGTLGSNRTNRTQVHLYQHLGGRYASGRAELVEVILSRLLEQFAESVARHDWRSAAECFAAAECLSSVEGVPADAT